MVQTVVTCYLIIMSVIGFFQMMTDKKKSRKHMWRISERTLLLTAALGGALGSWIGMYLFRHKTKHPRFYICVPLFLVIQALIYVLYFYYTSYRYKRKTFYVI